MSEQTNMMTAAPAAPRKDLAGILQSDAMKGQWATVLPKCLTADRLAQWVDGRRGRPPLTFELRRDPGLILDVFAQEMPDKGFLFSFTDVTAERRAIEDISRAFIARLKQSHNKSVPTQGIAFAAHL